MGKCVKKQKMSDKICEKNLDGTIYKIMKVE